MLMTVMMMMVMMMMMMMMMPTPVIRVKSEKCAQVPPLTPTRSKLTNWEPAEAGNQKRALLVELITFVIIIIRKLIHYSHHVHRH